MNDQIVMKWGSNCVVIADGLDQEKIDNYACRVAELEATYGLKVITTASGSVAAGKRLAAEMGMSISDKQVLAGMGSPDAARAWQQAYRHLGIAAAQVLVTHREIDDSSEGSSLTQALTKNSRAGVRSIVNENDIISKRELKKLAYGGDNDGLAVHLAIRTGALAVVLLTSVDGFEIDGEVQSEIQMRDLPDLMPHFYASSGDGTGSMRSKVTAAAWAAENNLLAFIANAEADYDQVLNGEVGTRVVQ